VKLKIKTISSPSVKTTGKPVLASTLVENSIKSGAGKDSSHMSHAQMSSLYNSG